MRFLHFYFAFLFCISILHFYFSLLCAADSSLRRLPLARAPRLGPFRALATRAWPSAPQPLTAELEMPWMMYFWPIRKMMIIGMIPADEAAIMPL